MVVEACLLRHMLHTHREQVQHRLAQVSQQLPCHSLSFHVVPGFAVTLLLWHEANQNSQPDANKMQTHRAQSD